MDRIAALQGRTLDLGNDPKRPLTRPPPTLIGRIRDCANQHKVSGALQRLVFVLMQGQPELLGGENTFDARSVRSFIQHAAWSFLVYNMVAFRFRDGRGGRIFLSCVPIHEGGVERGRDKRTGELRYRWVRNEEEPAGVDDPFIFSVNPAEVSCGWFNSPVMNLMNAVQAYEEMHSNYLAADHVLARPPIPLVYDRAKLFGARNQGDVALGDISETNGMGVQDQMLLVHQAVRSSLQNSSAALMDAQQYDINAASAASGVAPIYQEVEAVDYIHRRVHATGPVLYITPGFAPAASGYAPSRNPDFMKVHFIEQEISSQLGIPVHWLSDSVISARNTVDSESDADKLKIAVKILRQHLIDLFDFIDDLVQRGDPRDPLEAEDCPAEPIALRWVREVEMRTIYVQTRAEPQAKRRKTETEEDMDAGETESADEDEIEPDPGDINDAA